jgi:hypothetical protein
VLEDQPDRKLVEDTLIWIRETLRRTLNRAAVEVGGHVFDRFYGGDPERVRARTPRKPASLRMLTERCGTIDLPISRSALHRAVEIAVMIKALPEKAAYKQLPPTHQATLAVLRDPGKVEKLAERALDRKLPVSRLKGLVAAELAKLPPDGRGRKPTPELLKALTRSVKLFTLDEGRGFTRSHADELSDEQRRLALRAARRLAGSLEKILEYLGQ